MLSPALVFLVPSKSIYFGLKKKEKFEKLKMHYHVFVPTLDSVHPFRRCFPPRIFSILLLLPLHLYCYKPASVFTFNFLPTAEESKNLHSEKHTSFPMLNREYEGRETVLEKRKLLTHFQGTLPPCYSCRLCVCVPTGFRLSASVKTHPRHNNQCSGRLIQLFVRDTRGR